MKYINPKSYDKPIKISKDKTLGYLYFFDKEHPLSDVRGKVYHHRHIASLVVGKWIDSSYHVHHKDGNRSNNSEENLEVISPKMHATKHHIEKGNTLRKIKRCDNCNEKFISVSGTKFCSRLCMGFYNRFFEISTEELEKMVWEKPTTHIAKHFNVSDSAIGKRCKILGIKKPSRGYWAKLNNGKKHKS